MAPADKGTGECPLALESLLKNPDVEVRWLAICRLHQMAEELLPEHAPAIADCLGDEDASVRQYAGETLIRMSAAGTQALVKLIEMGSEPVIQESALRALGGGCEAGVKAVMSRIGHANVEVRTAAVVAAGRLARWAKTRAQEVAALLGDKDGAVQAAACEVLVAMGEEGAAAATSQLSHGSAAVRLLAVTAIGRCGEQGGLQAVSLARMLADGEAEVSDATRRAFGSLGVAGAATLSEFLASGKTDWRTEVARGLALSASAGTSMQPHVAVLMGCLKDRIPEVRALAADALFWTTACEEAAAVASALVAQLGDADVGARHSAEQALSQMESDGLQKVLEAKALDSQSPEVRTAAIRVVGRIGVKGLQTSTARAIVLSIVSALDDEHEEVATAGLEAIGGLPGHLTQPYVEVLVKCLTDESPAVQAEAVLTMGRMGAELVGDNAMQQAIPLLQHEEPAVRRATAVTMTAFGQKASFAARPLAQRLKEDPDATVRAQSAQALGRLGSASSQFVQALSKGLNDADLDVRMRSLEAFGELGLTAPQAVVMAAPILANIALQDSEEKLRITANAALSKIGKAGVASMMTSLSDIKAERKAQGMEAFERLGQEDQAKYAYNVGRLLQDGDASTRKRSSMVVSKLGETGLRFIPAFREQLQDKDPSVREQAALALHKMGVNAVSKVIQELARNLSHAEGIVRASSAVALGAGGMSSKAHVATICKMLSDEDTVARQGAVKALGQLGRLAVDGIPMLSKILDSAPQWAELVVCADNLAILGEVGLNKVGRSLEDPNPLIRQACTEAIGKAGGDVAGCKATLVVRRLQDREPAVRAAARAALLQLGEEGSQQLEEDVDQVEHAVRQGIVESWGHYAEVAEPQAIAVAMRLADCLRSVRRAAAKAIVEIGGGAVPVLVEGLKGSDAHIRRCVAEALGCLGVVAADASEALADCVVDEDPVVQEVAILALGQLGPRGLAAVAANLAADRDGDLRRMSAEALGRLGETAASHAPTMAAHLEDEDPQVRDALVWALGQLGPAGPQALVDLLGDSRAEIKRGACGGLGRLGRNAARHSVAVAAQLGDRVAAQSAAEALLRFGEAGSTALASRFEDPDVAVRVLVIETLGRAGKLADQYVPKMVGFLEDPEPLIRRVAAASFGQLGDAGKPHVAALAGRLTDEDAWVRSRAAESLGQLGAASASKQLGELLAEPEDHEWGWRSPDFQAWGWNSAAEALRRCGAASPEHATLLQCRFDDTSPAVRAAAASATGKLGPTATCQLEALAALLKDKDAQVRKSAAQAIGEVGGVEAAPFASHLVEAFADASPEVRAAAVLALKSLGKHAADHSSAVVKALKDSHGSVRQAAAATLPSLGDEGIGNLPHLAPLLDDGRAGVREGAYAELVRFGTAGGSLILVSEASDTSVSPTARRLASRGLAELGRDAGDQAEGISQLLLDSDSIVRDNAAAALKKMGARGLAELERMLQSPHEHGRVAAAQVLGDIGRAASASAGALAERLDDHSPLVRRASAQALGRLGDAAAMQLPKLASLLEAHDVLLFKSTLDTIGVLGKRANSHADCIAFRLDAAVPDVRQKAAFTLGTLGDGAGKYDPDLLRALEDPDPATRANAAGALGKRSTPDLSCRAGLERCLADVDGRVRARAAESLGNIFAGKEEVELAAMLAPLTEDFQSQVRHAAARALAGLAPQAMALQVISAMRIIENNVDAHDIATHSVRVAGVVAREFGLGFPHHLGFLHTARPRDPSEGPRPPANLFPLCSHGDIPDKLGCALSCLHPARHASLPHMDYSVHIDAYVESARAALNKESDGSVDSVLRAFRDSQNTGRPKPLSDRVEATMFGFCQPAASSPVEEASQEFQTFLISRGVMSQ